MIAAAAHAQNADVGKAAFREIYQEMVEIDSSPSTGSCTKVVRAAETRLQAAGFAADDVQVVIPEGKPDDGNIVARIRAPGAKKKGVLLLAHIDVVDAKRADWERDPFKLVEENGFFYGRGAADDKAMAAVFLDLMVRLKKERGFKPKRDLIMALTCGEETSNRVNGVDYLLKNKRELIDAAFALNEGAGGLLSPDGQKHLVLQVQAGEKIHQVFTLEVSNKGGHSSRPERENAIYRLARATLKVEQLAFPLELTPVVREYFRVTGPTLGGEIGAAMSAVAKNPNDPAALATLMNDPSYNAVLHTTCVATQLDAGHAPNALPQRATATLSCRVMQGTTPEQVKEALEKAVADDPGQGGDRAPPQWLAGAGAHRRSHEARARGRREAVARRAGRAVDDRGRHRRPLSHERGNPDVRYERHVRRVRRKQCARPQRKDPRDFALRRTRISRKHRARVREVAPVLIDAISALRNMRAEALGR